MQLKHFAFIGVLAAVVSAVPNGHRQKPAESLDSAASAAPSSTKASGSGLGIGLGL
ncbi:hypothetical protein IWW55_005971, partial [Coemansia sp. RSA 2706]